MDSAHLVGHRTDAADACSNVWSLSKIASAQERFKKARWLKDFQLHVDNFALLDLDPHGALAFDPREVIDFNGARLTHELRFLCGRRRRMH